MLSRFNNIDYGIARWTGRSYVQSSFLYTCDVGYIGRTVIWLETQIREHSYCWLVNCQGKTTVGAINNHLIDTKLYINYAGGFEAN